MAMPLSMLLAEQILRLLDDSGAREVEKLAALDIARAIVPVSLGSLHSKTQGQEASPDGESDPV